MRKAALMLWLASGLPSRLRDRKARRRAGARTHTAAVGRLLRFMVVALLWPAAATAFEPRPCAYCVARLKENQAVLQRQGLGAAEIAAFQAAVDSYGAEVAACSQGRTGPTGVCKGDLDTDGDGIPDRLDKCPHEPEDKDGFQDEDGCPDPDNDGDGIPDSLDKCPLDPEDIDGFQDDDGCPDPDNDLDGILDVADRCPNQPGPASNHGCPIPEPVVSPPPLPLPPPPLPLPTPPGPIPPAVVALPVPSTGDYERGPVTKMSQPEAFALIIGIERYRGDLPPAEHAERDARAFASYATRTLGVPEDHVKLLVGDHASKGDIEAALMEWLPGRSRPGAPVYFYYSGHGAPDPVAGDTYLLPWDGEPEYLKSKALPLARVYRELAKNRRKVVAFVDACFSGAGGRSVLPKGARPLVAVRPTKVESGSLAVFSAASGAQISGPAETAAHGLFTWHLLRGLSGLADRDGDRTVTLHELQLFVARQVTAEAKKANREQVPELSVPEGTKPGDWIVVSGLME